MAELIDREAVLDVLKFKPIDDGGVVDDCIMQVLAFAKSKVNRLPAVDAVEVATLESWLYEIAMNNIGAPVADMAEACDEIISRLGGLRKFAGERREENAASCDSSTKN